MTADDLAKKELAAIYASGEPPVVISSVEMENWATLSRIRGIRIQEPVPYITTTAIWRILIYKMGQEKLGAFIDGLNVQGDTEWERDQIREERKQQSRDLDRMLRHFGIGTRVVKTWDEFRENTLMHSNNQRLIVPLEMGLPPGQTFLEPAPTETRSHLGLKSRTTKAA